MSTPDARLNAAERAALADLEAAAAAADPSLATRLRGGRAWRARPILHVVSSRITRVWTALLGIRWWGVPLTLLGFFLMVTGLSTAVAVSLAGAVVAAIGLRVTADAVLRRLRRNR